MFNPKWIYMAEVNSTTCYLILGNLDDVKRFARSIGAIRLHKA